MNSLDQSLERLFKAASGASKPEPEALPGHLETRVLAEWRSLRREDGLMMMAGLFRRAVICASVIMLASIVWSHLEKPNAATSVLALANYEINAHLPP